MTSRRQNADHRATQLRLAIARIERGKAHTKAERLTISAVAKEVGVTPALIHNHYPAIAEEIRAKSGASSRAQRDAKHAELKQVRESKKALQEEMSQMRKRIAQLASINETLRMENEVLRAVAADRKVVSISTENR